MYVCVHVFFVFNGCDHIFIAKNLILCRSQWSAYSFSKSDLFNDQLELFIMKCNSCHFYHQIHIGYEKIFVQVMKK